MAFEALRENAELVKRLTSDEIDQLRKEAEWLEQRAKCILSDNTYRPIHLWRDCSALVNAAWALRLLIKQDSGNQDVS